MAEADQPRCGSCANYDPAESFCRVEKRKKQRFEYCPNYKIILADSYIPNPWDEWRKKKERETGGKRPVSSGS